MHYIGTLGMIFPGKLNYNPGVVAGSTLIGVLGATIAYWILFRFLALYPEKELYRILCAAVMSVAICGMHFTGSLPPSFPSPGLGSSVYLHIEYASKHTTIKTLLNINIFSLIVSTGCAGTQFIYTGISQSTLSITITAQTTIVTSVLVGLGMHYIFFVNYSYY